MAEYMILIVVVLWLKTGFMSLRGVVIVDNGRIYDPGECRDYGQ